MTKADDKVLPWRTPPLSGAAAATTLSAAHSKELEQLRAQARQEGLQAGRDEALEQQRAWIEERLDQFSQILQAISKPYEELNEQVAEELALLAGKISQQLIRRELQTAPEAIVGVVREAIACLPEDREGARVYLNHQDVELVKELSRLSSQDRNWELLSDPALPRGDCLVSRGATRIDASLDARIRAICTQLIGGERAQDADA
ncbi:MAG: FliH/SctL family protein [Halieaceae bacterium]